MKSPVIVEQTSLGIQTQIFEETTDYNKTAAADCLVTENACCALLDVWPDNERTTEIIPEPNCSDEIPHSNEVIPEPISSEEIPNSIIPEPNCSDEILNSNEVIPESRTTL